MWRSTTIAIASVRVATPFQRFWANRLSYWEKIETDDAIISDSDEKSESWTDFLNRRMIGHLSHGAASPGVIPMPP